MKEDGTERTLPSISPKEWFEDDVISNRVFYRPRTQFQQYLKSHSISSKIKNITMPKKQVETLSNYNKAIQNNILKLAIPANTPNELQSALE